MKGFIIQKAWVLSFEQECLAINPRVHVYYTLAFQTLVLHRHGRIGLEAMIIAIFLHVVRPVYFPQSAVFLDAPAIFLY